MYSAPAESRRYMLYFTCISTVMSSHMKAMLFLFFWRKCALTFAFVSVAPHPCNQLATNSHIEKHCCHVVPLPSIGDMISEATPNLNQHGSTGNANGTIWHFGTLSFLFGSIVQTIWKPPALKLLLEQNLCSV